MLGSIRVFAGTMIVATGFLAPALSTTVARADHDSFEYRGPRYGFHGEAHMIEALRLLDRAYYADHSSHHLIWEAKLHIRDAMGDLSSDQARYSLDGALDHLFEYRHWHRGRDLDDAARLVTKALAIERETHRVARIPVGHELPGHRHHGPDHGVKVTPQGVGVSWGHGRLFIRF